MSKVKKGNVLLVLLMALIAMFSCFFGVFNLKDTRISASAETIEYQDYLGLEDRTSWASGGHADIVTLGIMDFSITEGNQYFKSSVSDCWYYGNNDVIAANNGVDILQYVYLNGVSARTLIDANQTEQKTTANTGYWLSNPAAWPIALETGTDCWIRIDKTKFGGDFTFTFKAGFSLIRNDGEVIYLTNDVEYTYVNGVLAKKPVEGGEGGGEEEISSYTLTFEGLDDTITVTSGQAIGELPAVPEQAGYTGVWAIDGVAITANTVYNYGADKTATVIYTKDAEKTDVTDTVKIEFANHSAVQSMFKIFITPAASLTTNGWWNIQGQDAALTAANNGVDIMEYIYINGENIRTLSNNNRTNNTYPLGSATGWLGNSDQCRPVFVETNGEGIWVTVLHSFSTENYVVTLKAGFSIVDASGNVSVINKDVEFMCASGGGVTKVESFVLSFEGTEETKTVKTGQAIGELPAYPEVEGKVVIGWAIDGEKLTADTVWTYSEDKTATPIYLENYTLSFEGLDDTITVTSGQAIGELPAVPEQAGYTGVWAIDGVAITANTVYNYGADKTATVIYTKDAEKTDVTDTVKIEFANHSAVQSMFKIFITPAASLTTNSAWNIQGWDTALIAANNGVDIMEYIYVNGENVRALSNNNRTNNTYPLGSATGWLGNSDQCRPVFVETNGEGIWVTVLHAFSTENYVVTLKAGFSIVDASGNVSVINKDVEFHCGTGGIVTKVESFVLSFEGTEETKIVKTGQAIGELPAYPEVEGKVVIGWAIDGTALTADTVWTYSEDKTATPIYLENYTLTFEGLDDTITVTSGQTIGELPAMPEVDGKIAIGWAIDGVAITANTAYNYGADKTATPVYALEYQSFLGLEDRTSWGACNDNEYYFGGIDLGNNTYFNAAASVCGTWHADNSGIIAANNGVDIMEYIHVNGVSARKLITDNYTGSQVTNSCGCWLSNPAASPVYVETTGNDGILVRLLKSFVDDAFTITFKAGFSLIRNDGEVIYVSSDIEYVYENGILGKDFYTLSFEGSTEAKTLRTGEAIGELPTVPAVEGKVGFWAIDGVEISADTTYNYTENKTATLVYCEGTDIFGTLDMANWGAVIGEDSTYIRVGNWKDGGGNLMMSTAFSNLHWQDNADKASENFGCDIMQYIYINGKSARAISIENGQTNAYGGEGKATTFPFNYGGIYAPVDVYTSGDEFYILIMTEYVASADLVITFKAGFRIATSDGGMLYLSQDFTFPYYTVAFDNEVVRVMPGATVAEPATPTKEETESHTYAFEGWYNGETKWDFRTPITENIVLTAKFIETEKAKYTVTFDGDNGEEAMVVSVYENACVKAEQIPANPVKPSDDATYNFLFWSIDGEKAYDFATPITEDITLTAVYTTKAIYIVKTGETTQNVVDGEKAVKPADPVKESTAEFDFVFEGWYNGETKWDFENDVVTQDIELVAKYTELKRKYTISFNVTGNDEISFETVEVEYGTVYDLSNLLDGKDVSAYTYTITVDGEAATSVTVLSNVTVDVTFAEKAYYTVTIDGVDQTVEEGTKATKPATEPTKESTAEFDYIFDGWYNGETKWDFANDAVTENLELIAKYTEVKRKYMISFNVTGNDSIKLDPVEVEYGTNYDLSKLLEGKDVTGYTYSISVNGVEKAGVKVVGDTTVDVTFTKKADGGKTESKGCGSIVSGATGAILAMAALGVLVVFKKKED